MSSPKTQGPNVRRLVVMKMSFIMVPPGGGVGGVLDTLTRPGGIASAARQATEWVEAAIAAAKAAPDNTLTDDEAIAGVILREIAAKNPSICERCGRTKYHSRLRGYRCVTCD